MENEKMEIVTFRKFKEPKGLKSSSFEILEKLMLMQKKLKTVLSFCSNPKCKGKDNLSELMSTLNKLNLKVVKKDLETLQKIKETLQTAKMNSVMIIDSDTLEKFDFHSDKPNIVELSSDEKEDLELEFDEKYSIIQVEHKNSLKAYFEMETFYTFNEAIDSDCTIM